MEKMEIKFRAWDTENKIMSNGMPFEWFITGDDEDMEFPKTGESLPLNDFVWSRKDFILMQFTGLKDKNGKEVYEGDILTPTVYKGGSGKNWTGFKCEVIFSKGMFCFKTNGVLIQSEKPLCNSLYLGEQSNNGFEIIGNIWENKNLLQ